MNYSPIKTANKFLALKIVLVYSLIALAAFGWHVRTVFDVVANGETWLSSDCYRVRNGFSTLLLAAINPQDEAAQEMRAGRQRLMPNIFVWSPGFSRGYNSTTPHGLECRNPVPIRDPFGNARGGDMLENKCAQFSQNVQACLIEAYNYHIYTERSISDQDNCVWTHAAPRSNCATVEASWTPFAKTKVGE